MSSRSWSFVAYCFICVTSLFTWYIWVLVKVRCSRCTPYFSLGYLICDGMSWTCIAELVRKMFSNPFLVGLLAARIVNIRWIFGAIACSATALFGWHDLWNSVLDHFVAHLTYKTSLSRSWRLFSWMIVGDTWLGRWCLLYTVLNTMAHAVALVHHFRHCWIRWAGTS